MFNSKGMTHLGFALEKKQRERRWWWQLRRFHNVPPCSLHPTSLRYTTQGDTIMNSGEKPWRWGKPKRGEEIQQVFGEDQRRRTAACPNPLSSLHFLSLSPFCSWSTSKDGGAGRGRGDGLGIRGDTVARCYCSMVRPLSSLEKTTIFLSKLQKRHVNSQTECTRRALRNHSVHFFHSNHG